MHIYSLTLVLFVAIVRTSCQETSSSVDTPHEVSRAVKPITPEEVEGSSELKRTFSEDVEHEATVTYPKSRSSQVNSYRAPRNNDFSGQQQIIIKPGKKIKPGQFVDQIGKRKNSNWDLPDYLKSAISPSDSKVSWGYWEADDSEFWPDDADDSMPTTEAPMTTTTTTTPAPTTKAEKIPIAIHKHFHYFKKAAPWKSPMPPEDMMKMTEEMMNEMMMMKGMMMPDTMTTMMPEKKGLSGVLLKLSAVDPITVLVAGIIPASLILAAALPSVMNKMINGNKGDSMMPMMPMMPPMMPTMMPMVMTTAMGRDGIDSRNHEEHSSMAQILQDASNFGFQVLKKPRCARKMFCRLAKESLMSDTPEFQRALQIATVAMQNTWLDVLGVREILHSLSLGTCDDAECEAEAQHSTTETGTTQSTPAS